MSLKHYLKNQETIASKAEAQPVYNSYEPFFEAHITYLVGEEIHKRVIEDGLPEIIRKITSLDNVIEFHVSKIRG